MHAFLILGMTINEKFGLRLREMRLERELSQEKLGFTADLHRTYISDIERGVKNPTIVTLETLAKALGVTISELCEGIDT